jgi:hypothetical protein
MPCKVHALCETEFRTFPWRRDAVVNCYDLENYYALLLEACGTNGGEEERV